MNKKHLDVRIRQCIEIAKASNCTRRQVGALLIDPERNVILADAYNGAPREGGELCGGSYCLRDECKIESSKDIQIGCHHAEMNLICNAAANGTKTAGAWLIVNCVPCIMCAKLIHHAGIKKVMTISNTYSTDISITYLKKYGIEVEFVPAR